MSQYRLNLFIPREHAKRVHELGALRAGPHQSLAGKCEIALVEGNPASHLVVVRAVDSSQGPQVAPLVYYDRAYHQVDDSSAL